MIFLNGKKLQRAFPFNFSTNFQEIFLKTKDGQGRVAAFEVMKCTAPIQNLIREAKIHQIPSIMQTSVRDGMVTMQKSLEDLVKAGKIDAGAGKEH